MNGAPGLFGLKNDVSALHAHSSPPPDKWSSNKPIIEVTVIAGKDLIKFIIQVQNGLGKKGQKLKNYRGPGQDKIQIITNGIEELNTVPETIWKQVRTLEMWGRKPKGDVELALIIQKSEAIREISIRTPDDGLRDFIEEVAKSHASTLAQLSTNVYYKQTTPDAYFNYAWISPFTQLSRVFIMTLRNGDAEGVELMPRSLTSFISSLVISEDTAAWMSQNLVNLRGVSTYIEIPLEDVNIATNVNTIKRFCNLEHFEHLLFLVLSRGVRNHEKWDAVQLKSQVTPWLELCSSVEGIKTCLQPRSEDFDPNQPKEDCLWESPHYLFHVYIDRKVFKGFH